MKNAMNSVINPVLCAAAMVLIGQQAWGEPTPSDDPAIVQGGGNRGVLPGQSPLGFPIDGSSNISVNADLVWIAASDAKFYDLYFGTDPTPDNGEFLGTIFDTSYTLGVLNGDTNYYWRIDPKNFVGTTTGVVWSFTTEHLPAPDMVATSCWYPVKQDYQIGGPVSVTSSVDNAGDLDATGVVIDIYLSTNNFISTSDTLLESVNLGNLPAGAATLVDTRDVNLPGTLVPGTYYIGFIVSQSGANEPNQTNNSVAGSAPITVVPAISDLVVVDLNYVSMQYEPGGDVSVNIRVRNDGTVPINGIQYDFYASSNTTITIFDTLLESITQPDWTLDVGFISWRSIAVNIPSDIAWGDYYIGVIVSEPGVTDANPSDNVISGSIQVPIIGDAPDLTPMRCDYDSGPSYSIGGVVEVDLWIKNIGALDATDIVLDFYASVDNNITPADTLIYTENTGVTLNPGGSMFWIPPVPILLDMAQGSYYIGYIISEGSGIEFDLSNNAISGDLPISVDSSQLFPDMRAVECTYNDSPIYSPGDTISVFDRTTNDGQGWASDIHLNLYLSSNSTITTSDTLIGGNDYDLLTPGRDVFSSSHVVLPANLASGDYYIGFIATEPNNLDINLNNNAIAGSAPISVVAECAADLNNDGSLNFFDVSAFLSAFAAQDPAADFTNDGAFNFFDVSAFLSAFAVGCP
jgi:hypothetical protein